MVAMKRELPETYSTQTQYRRCAKSKNCKTCNNGPGHGPYLYACFRDEAGKVKNQYLGPKNVKPRKKARETQSSLPSSALVRQLELMPDGHSFDEAKLMTIMEGLFKALDGAPIDGNNALLALGKQMAGQLGKSLVQHGVTAEQFAQMLDATNVAKPRIVK